MGRKVDCATLFDLLLKESLLIVIFVGSEEGLRGAGGGRLDEGPLAAHPCCRDADAPERIARDLGSFAERAWSRL